MKISRVLFIIALAVIAAIPALARAEDNNANGTFKGPWALGHYSGTIEFTLSQDGKKLAGVVTELTGMPHDPGRELSGYIKKNWVLLDFEDGKHRISATLTGDVIEGELSSSHNRGTIRVERVK